MSRQPGATKTCPLCGEPMKAVTRRLVDHIPGMQHSIEREQREWACPNCDHYEEVEEGEDSSG